MNLTFIVIVSALLVLGLSLLATIIWLLYRFARKKKKAKPSGPPCSIKKKQPSVSLPPVFEVPLQYSTAKVQSPIYPLEKQFPSSPENEMLIQDTDFHKHSLSNLSDGGSDQEAIAREFRNIRSLSLAVTSWRSTPDITCPGAITPPEETSRHGSPKQVRCLISDTKRRKISVDLYQHLRAQGRKAISMSAIPPALSEDPVMDTLPVAAAAHWTRGGHDSSRVSIDSSSLSAIQSDSDDESAGSDVTEESDSMAQRVRKRIGRRRTSEPVTFKKAGKITFSTAYHVDQKKLEVHIHRAFDICKRKAHDNIYPFVRLYLLPGKKGKQHTKVQKKTKEPFFNEKKYFYDLGPDDLKKNRLKIKLYNRDSVTKIELIGEADMALGSLNTSLRETFNLGLTLMTPVESNGQIMVSLCHQATFSQLQVIIHKAKNLRKVGIMGTPDPYVSVLFCRDNGWEKKDTKAKRSTRHPVFNETLNFDVTTDSTLPLSTFSLVVTVTHRSLVGKDEILGHVIFSLDSPQTSSTEHWRSVTSSPHKLEAEWHALLDPEDL